MAALIRGAQISVSTPNLEGGPLAFISVTTPPGVPRWGAAYRDFLTQSYAKHAVMVAQTENLPYGDQTVDIDPDVRDAWGLPAPRLTYDWLRPNEVARVEFMMKKMEEIGHAMGGSRVWRNALSPGPPGAHHEGGTRMGNATSVVNKYGQTWDISNLFVIGSSTFPSMSGFNPTLTIQALAYMSADAIANRYKSRARGPCCKAGRTAMPAREGQARHDRRGRDQWQP
jgi:gluconate 2-dehydrogenase alpha chain